MAPTLVQLRKKVKARSIPWSSYLGRDHLDSFLSRDEWSLGWRFSLVKPQCKNKEDVKMATGCLLGPVRDLSKYRKVQSYLKRNRVYTTMTTSPLRLRKLQAVLATLDVSNLAGIYIVLPERYGRKKEKYRESDIRKIKAFPKVRVIRTKKDYGPLTKALPVIRRMRNKNNLVISIDDDVAYPMGMVNEMIYQKVVKHPRAVIEGCWHGHFRSIKKFKDRWPQKKKGRDPNVDLVEGWQAVGYTPALVNTKLMEKYAGLSKDCYFV